LRQINSARIAAMLPRRLGGPVRICVLAGCLALQLAWLQGCGGRRDDPPQAAAIYAPKLPLAGVDPEIVSFYQTRSFRLLWTTPAGLRTEALQLLQALEGADRDGLDPYRYLRPGLVEAVEAASAGDAQAILRAEVLLSRAFTDYVRDLREPRGLEPMVFIDRQLAPRQLDKAAILAAAEEAPSLAAYLVAVQRMNPIYEELRDALARHFASGGSEKGARIIRANLERARMIPADPGQRFVLVDSAGATLRLYENGRVVDTMRVIVGKPSMPTPAMAAAIRFAVFNPYSNIPPDLVRQNIARSALRQGGSYLERERLQVLSDFTPAAVPVDPESVDWRAVASGGVRQRVRQLPGGNNMMGEVKFMFPNSLGIYLHDTPNKASFAFADRRRSSGCVRVEDARRLAAWLFRREMSASGTTPEERRDLPEPVPVYITYLTAVSAGNGVLFQKDLYDRDSALLARLEDRRGRSSTEAARTRSRLS
jgi:murein L,D-transpeptidase YcbB/YkuD